jgi:glycosyltransferase involved in cell wall biosynthesis
VRESLIVIGPSPPPVHGVAAATMAHLGALRQLGLLAGHLDTRDARSIQNMGVLDLENVRLAVRHSRELIRLLRQNPEAGILVQISQGTWGIVRDTVLVAVACARRRRVYVHLNGGYLRRYYDETNPVMRGVTRWTLCQATQVWAVTPSLRRLFDGLVAPDRVRFIENVVEDTFGPNGGSARTSRANGGSSTGFRVLHLANLLPEKGCFDLLDALAELGELAAGWSVRLVGAAATEVHARLEERAAALRAFGIDVELRGPRTGEAKLDEYRWADLFAYPSRYPPEGQPFVLLEAMAAGLPIVSTRHAGIPDTVGDEREGVLVKPGDVPAIGAAVLRLARDTRLRKELGENARRRYELRYRPERLVEALGELLVYGPTCGSGAGT